MPRHTLIPEPRPDISSAYNDAKNQFSTNTQNFDTCSQLAETSSNESYFTQQTITPLKDNAPYGDLLVQEKPAHTLRIFYKNKNGIYKGNNWAQWTTACESIQKLNIDICGFTETNLK
jgi:hypothetical protein